jgi:hypothetical protein
VRRFPAHFAVLSIPLLALVACSSTPPPLPPLPPPLQEIVQHVGERAGVVFVKDAYGDGASKLVYLDQGWAPLETLWY